MENKTHWYDNLAINAYWLGINIGTGTITPVLLPYLVVIFMPEAQKNTYLAIIRVIGLAVAMLVQPLAGMLSDRSTSRFGRRRPFIVAGALLNCLFLLVIGISPAFLGSPADSFFLTSFGVTAAYAVLLAGIVLWQASSNLGHGALQGLIPDLVPEGKRGMASGVKSVLELLPVFLVIFIGPLVDAGQIWLVVGILAFGFIATMLVNVLLVPEVPLTEKPVGSIREPAWRLVALTVIFVGVTQAVIFLVGRAGQYLTVQGASQAVQVVLVGLAGLLGMAVAIFAGVYFGAWVGIGKEAREHQSFIWWVVNRLLFLAAVGSIQGFAQYFLRDVLHLENAATMTTILLAVVALFLIPSALYGGKLADKYGKKRFVFYSGLIAAAGAFLLLSARSIPLVIVSGCIIGLGTGTFYATNWALGTLLAPKQDAGHYLGISNLAGAGAGIVGAGIGGPMADFFNALQGGLGYLVIFAIYGALFLLSVLVLRWVKIPEDSLE